jgi:hypothetical protein
MRGSETPNQRSISTMSVPNGTADADCLPHATMLTQKKMRKHTPGKSVAVSSVALKWFGSRTSLQKRADTYPAPPPRGSAAPPGTPHGGGAPGRAARRRSGAHLRGCP